METAVKIDDRVATTRDGPGRVLDIIYTELRSLRHGVFSSKVYEVDVAFDNGITKFVPSDLLLSTLTDSEPK
jgi:hypothetical protein